MLNVTLDACAPGVLISVTETQTEVNVRVDRRWNPTGDNLMCVGHGIVALSAPIGSRHVVDGHGGRDVRLVFESELPPYVPPAPIAGSVADVVGHEAPLHSFSRQPDVERDGGS